MFKNETVNINGHEYNVDPTNGLPCVSVIQHYRDDWDECFDWAIPDGYHYYDFRTKVIDDPELKSYESIFTVWFGTLKQLCELTPGCTFTPAS